MGTLYELAEVLLDVVLETPKLIVLGNFNNIHVDDTSLGPAQDFIVSLTALGLSQIVSGPTHDMKEVTPWTSSFASSL